MPANSNIKYQLLKLIKQTEPPFMDLEDERVLATMARFCDVHCFFEDLEKQFPAPEAKLSEVRNRLEQRLFAAYIIEAIFCLEKQNAKEASACFKKAYALFSQAGSQIDPEAGQAVILAINSFLKKKAKTK